MIVGAIYVVLLGATMLSTFTEKNVDFPVGLIVFNAVAIACFAPFIFHYNSRLRDHEATVAVEKEKRANEVKDNILSTATKVTETRAIIESQPRVKTVINNVTLNFGNGASFTGPFAVGENIKISYEAATDTNKADLRKELEEVVKLMTTVIDSLSADGEKGDTATQLKTFVEEAKKDKPNKWLLDVSSKGLLEAATTVASMVTPVTTAVKAVLALVTGNA